MTSGIPTLCYACARRTDESLVDLPSGPKCDAFPQGIPVEIWAGGFDHREEWPGDQGLRFVQAAGEDAAATVQLADELRALTRLPEQPGADQTRTGPAA